MEEILSQIQNGQRKAALATLIESPFTFEDLICELAEIGDCDEVLRMVRVAANVGYIKFDTRNAKVDR